MPSVTESWEQAQRLEAAGTREAARPHYEAILDVEPGHVPARLRLSRLEQAAGRYTTARAHALQAAAAVRERHGSRHAGFVSARLLEFAEEQEAATLILACDWSDPDILRQSPVLAQHLWLAGHYHDALRLLDVAIRVAPAHPLLALTRANVLRYLGDMDGAERGYEACLALAPALADAHWALATHRRAQPPLARVPRLQQALRATPDDPQARTHLLYALFREYDAADQPELAWAALEEGAALARTRVAYDPRREAAALQRLMREPVAAPIATEASAGPRPLFVVGMPRTGTTLLDRILGNHDQVRSLGERNDLAAAVSEASGCFFHSGLDEAGATLLASVDPAQAGAAYLRRTVGAGVEGSHFIDKNPLNLFSVPLILRALPQARIVCLRRAPMDACFSNLKELFQGGAYPYSYTQDDLADHCRHAHAWMAHWQAVAPHAVRVVDYEVLVESPAATVAGLLAFAGLPPQAGLEDITRNTAPVSTASSSQVRAGISTGAVGAWRRYARWLEPMRQRLGVPA